MTQRVPLAQISHELKLCCRPKLLFYLKAQLHRKGARKRSAFYLTHTVISILQSLTMWASPQGCLGTQLTSLGENTPGENTQNSGYCLGVFYSLTSDMTSHHPITSPLFCSVEVGQQVQPTLKGRESTWEESSRGPCQELCITTDLAHRKLKAFYIVLFLLCCSMGLKI